MKMLVSHLVKSKCSTKFARNIFSLTGEWPKRFEPENLHKIEEHWKNRVPNLVKSAQDEIEKSCELIFNNKLSKSLNN